MKLSKNTSPSHMSKIRNKKRSLQTTSKINKRYRQERLFLLSSKIAMTFSIAVITALFLVMMYHGYSALHQNYLRLPVEFSLGQFKSENLREANYQALLDTSLYSLFPESASPLAKKELRQLLSPMAEFSLAEMVTANTTLIGTRQEIWLLANSNTDTFLKDKEQSVSDKNQRLNSRQRQWLTTLQQQGRVERRFNWNFFTAADSRQPESAGIYGALKGSFLTIVIALLLAFPTGVGAAVYFEEFAPNTRWTQILESSINNLAAVPPIVFGLLGLALLISWLHLPRATPLTAGMVLSLMILPTIVISSRLAIASVPDSIRNAALSLGASQLQTVAHHILPQALPSIITGTLIGMTQAFGECAPLLTIGMVAFVGNIPQSFTEPATTLPVQIYLWSLHPERAFMEKAAAAILVLLLILGTINTVAIFLRERHSKKLTP